MGKCKSCQSGFNGRNGNGYMPCGCKSKDDLSDADLLRQAHETLEARPRYVEPPPLIPIGHPRLGWKPKPLNLMSDGGFEYIPPFYHKAWIYLLIGVAIGYLVERLI